MRITNSLKTVTINFLYRMTVFMILAGTFGFITAGTAHAAGIIAYVKPSGLTTGTCDSWANGCDLQYALGLNPLPGEIWVAAGTYYPTTGTTRSATFTLKNGVSIYGGFDGTETLFTERDPAANVTLLSGNIGDSNAAADNSYHVVTASGTNSSAVLDGFTIMAGNANGSNPDYYGGGIYNTSGSPTLSNLIVSGNTAFFYGGGMYNNLSSPSITNVTFSSNSAQRGAGMYNNNASNLSLTNVTFSGNDASYRGGGMTVASSSPSLTNVTFSGNTAQRGGGLHNAFGGNPTLKNVTFSGNSATIAGGAIYNYDNSNPIIINSILYGNPGGEIFNEVISEGESVPVSTPVISYSIVQGGYPGTGNLNANPLLGALAYNGGYTQNMALGTDSPAIGAGDNANCPGTDQRGVTRPQGALCDIGAYELVDNTPPNTTIDTYPSNPSNSSSASFTFSGNDGGGSGLASLECQLDNGGYSTCTSPKSYDSLSEGGHTFQVRAIDKVNNADATPASYTWTVDISAPETTINTKPSDPDVDPTPTFTFSGNDGAGTGIGSFMCKVDGGSYSACSSPFTSPALLNGLHTFYVYAIDNALNADDTPASYTWTIARAGADTVGVFRPSNGLLYLKNQNTSGFADVAINYGLGGDYPVVGDWDGNGTDTIGVYRNGSFLLRNSNTLGFADLNFPFGQVGDQPIAGDWNGDGIDTIGVYRPSTGLFLLRNSNTAGAPDMTFYLGNVGDVGIAGDWNGDGIDTTGVFRPGNGIIFLKNTNATGFADVALNYGLSGDQPVVGDWDNDGITTIGIYRNARFYLRNSNTNGFADILLDLGNPGDMPIAGNWDGIP